MPTDKTKAKNNSFREEILEAHRKNIEAFSLFQQTIRNFFESPSLSKHVHSVRHRIKDIEHLMEKIERKNRQDSLLPENEQKGAINAKNLFNRVTDIAGVRVLHLHSSQMEHIHAAIQSKIDDDEFVLVEPPVAYTWDIDSMHYFNRIGIRTEIKESYYTSIHYVLRPNPKSIATCEVQIRTLLEETWGEIDHAMNYPHSTNDRYCKEQLKIFAKLIGAGTHLADSIMRKHNESMVSR